jgi:hypothetical protein
MAKLRNRFLSGLGLIFLVAFVSYYVQFPGLVSSSGIEPAGRIFPRAFPALYKHWWFNDIIDDSKEMWVAVDVLCEAACTLGIFLSALAAFGIIHHGILFFGMTMLYYFLVQLGGTFYSFQWDTLLLETGWVVSICFLEKAKHLLHMYSKIYVSHDVEKLVTMQKILHMDFFRLQMRQCADRFEISLK